MLVKMDATGRQIFAVPAACNDAAIVWSPDGNILTGGAKLSGVDGRLLFLTGDYPSVAGDTVGNVYSAGICGSTLCVEMRALARDDSSIELRSGAIFCGAPIRAPLQPDAERDVYGWRRHTPRLGTT